MLHFTPWSFITCSNSIQTSQKFSFFGLEPLALAISRLYQPDTPDIGIGRHRHSAPHSYFFDFDIHASIQLELPPIPFPSQLFRIVLRSIKWIRDISRWPRPSWVGNSRYQIPIPYRKFHFNSTFNFQVLFQFNQVMSKNGDGPMVYCRIVSNYSYPYRISFSFYFIIMMKNYRFIRLKG